MKVKVLSILGWFAFVALFAAGAYYVKPASKTYTLWLLDLEGQAQNVNITATDYVMSNGCATFYPQQTTFCRVLAVIHEAPKDGN